MKRTIKAATAAFALGVSFQAQAFNITFDYTYDSSGFFTANADRQNLLEMAGGYFSNILQDDFTAIDSSGFNDYTAKFTNPSSGLEESIADFNVAADEIVVFAGARDLGSSLGQGGPGGYDLLGFSDWVDDVITRGETIATSGVRNEGGATAVDTAIWGGSIAFDSDANWYYDSDVSTDDVPAGTSDFYSVALHELGHLLGLGIVDAWNNQVSGGSFTGAHSIAAYNATNPGATSVPLHFSGGAYGHWAEGTQGFVTGSPQEAAMDPTILVGTRKVFTDLDIAALQDIGYEVTAVPLPAGVWLMLSALPLLMVARARAKQEI